MSLSELTRLPSRSRAEEAQLILQGGGVPAIIEPVPGAGNGSGPEWRVLVPDEDLRRARQILDEESIGPERVVPLPPPGRRPPLYWTVGVIVANVAVWLALEGRGGSERRAVLLRFGASYAPLLRAGQWWRTVTATFLHIGLRHLLANMITLAILGPAVMEAWGVGRTYFMYLVAGVAGNWASFGISPGGAVKAGASGCILGLLGVLAGTRIRDIRARRAHPSRFKTWHIIAMLVAFYGFVVGVGHADHLAHLGGLLAGGLLAFALPRPGHLAPRADRRLATALGAAAVVLSLVAGVLAWLKG